MSEHKLSDSWRAAASFAARCHAGQVRKDGQTPYIAHPLRVALVVRHVFEVNDPIALAAALLHDVIEDTPADYDDLLEQFGQEVAETVAALTKDMRMPEAEREAAYDAQLARANWQAQLVKLADVYDNLSDVLSDRMREKTLEKVGRAIACAGDEPRLRRAVEVVRGVLE